MIKITGIKEEDLEHYKWLNEPIVFSVINSEHIGLFDFTEEVIEGRDFYSVIRKIKTVVDTHHYNKTNQGICAVSQEYLDNIEHYEYFYNLYYHIIDSRICIAYTIRSIYTQDEIAIRKDVSNSEQTWWQKFIRFWRK